ncbi:MAG: single-stranded DNA-binding protein [Clostridia bacterium]|nr:single-stranded DNA-binding protein [Clostridia bacterium]
MKIEQMNNNRVFLSGTVESEPKFSHETFGEAFYEITLLVPRLSNHLDRVPVTVSEKLLAGGKFEIGKYVCVKGQFRSYNKLEENKSKLMLTVFVREVCDFVEDMNPNIIEITGFICKEPTYRTTPFNREICDCLIAVNRAYNKSDYLPCIAWGRNAKYVSELSVGTKVNIVGRIQSREYQKHLDTGETISRIAYEVSINKILITEDQEETQGEGQLS